MNKVGACAGKFRILHRGHVEYFVRASMEVDELHIFFVSNENVVRPISEEQTIDAIKQILNKLDVKYFIHQTDFKDGEVWDQYLIDTIKKDFVIFNSKEDYENTLVKNKYLHCLNGPRISATAIEQNIYKYENFIYIAPEFQKYLVKKYYVSSSKVKKNLDYIFNNNLIRRFLFIVDENVSIEDEVNYMINKVLKENNIED